MDSYQDAENLRARFETLSQNEKDRSAKVWAQLAVREGVESWLLRGHLLCGKEFETLAIRAGNLLARVRNGARPSDPLGYWLGFVGEQFPSEYEDGPVGPGLEMRQLNNVVTASMLAADKLADMATDMVPPQEAEATPEEGGSDGRRVNAGLTVSDRMIKEILANPDVRGWTARQWVAHLHCGKTTVIDSKTWKELKIHRETLKAERSKDRRKAKRASETRRD